MTHIYLTIGMTCLLFLAVAYVKVPRARFYLGTGRYSAIVSAMSIVAAFTGGGTLINTTGLATKYGNWAYFDVVPSVGGLIIASVLVWVGFFGKRFSTSFFDVDSSTFNAKAVAVHYAQIVLLYLLVVSAQLRAVATLAQQLHFPIWTAVVLCCVIVAMYAYKGFDAVTRTDVVQLVFMIPMYIVLADIAFSQSASLPQATQHAHVVMPLSLAVALCLPIVFLPISQELHQRGAAVETTRKIAYSYIIAAALYGALGFFLVLAFSMDEQLRLTDLISGSNHFAGVVVTIGILAAILSTLDTSVNIASHALQKLKPFDRIPPALAQIILLGTGALLFLYFSTVLSLILFALFVYMAGPAFTFIGVYCGIHPKYCARVGTLFTGLQAFFHLKGGQILPQTFVSNYPSVTNPIFMGLTLLAVQAFVLIGVRIKRRLG